MGKAAFKPPTAASKVRQKNKTVLDSWVVEPVVGNPGASFACFLAVAFVVLISVWSPLGEEGFAKRFYQNGGYLQHCSRALAIAKGRSELRCWVKTTLPDGSVDRGLFGFNSKTMANISDACAFDCDCAMKEVVRISQLPGEAFSAYGNSTGLDLEKMIADTQNPCNAVAEELIKSGWSMTAITG